MNPEFDQVVRHMNRVRLALMVAMSIFVLGFLGMGIWRVVADDTSSNYSGLVTLLIGNTAICLVFMTAVCNWQCAATRMVKEEIAQLREWMEGIERRVTGGHDEG